MADSHQLVHTLLEQMTASIDALSRLDDADLEAASEHGCAMGGGLRRLLIHNIEHDRMHAAAMVNARYQHNEMQDSELARLLTEWLRQRVELVGQLIGASAEVLSLAAKGDDWDIAKQAEHVLYWEKDSVETAVREATARR